METKLSWLEGALKNMARTRKTEIANWLLARKINSVRGDHSGGDSRSELEALGFKVLDSDDMFYKVEPPQGWRKSKEGYWTTVRDSSGKERLNQFYKSALYDREAFLNIE